MGEPRAVAAVSPATITERAKPRRSAGTSMVPAPVAVGENIAAGATSAEEVMEGWLASPGHCENIMSPRFSEMGIAWVVDPKSASGVYWAQTFGTRRN